MNSLESLIELIGEAATLALIEAHAGTRVYIPKKTTKKNPLYKLLGEAAFIALCAHYGGDDVLVPFARQWRYQIYAKQKMRPIDMARRLGVSENTVYTYKRGDHRRPAGQLVMLFDER